MATEKVVYDGDAHFARVLHYDPNAGFDGDFTIQTVQDCEPIIETNKALRDAQTGKENFRLVARVPVEVAERAMREGWYHDDLAWKRWLNDQDNRDFRVWEGRV